MYIEKHIIEKAHFGVVSYRATTDAESGTISLIVEQANAVFASVVGIPHDELLGKEAEEVLLSAQCEGMRCLELLHQVVKTQESKSIEVYLPCVGEWFAVTAYLADEYCVAATYFNISAQKQAIEVEQNFFQVSLDLLCIADTSGRFLKVNPAWGEVLGYSVAELENASFMDFVHEEDKEATLEAIEKLAAQNKVVGFINRYKAKSGDYRYIEWRSFPSGDKIYAAARDVTRHKIAASELQQKNDYIDSLLSAIPDLLFIFDSNGKFLDYKESKYVETLLPAEQFLGKNVFDVFPNELGQTTLQALQYVIEKQEPTDIPDYPLTTSKGLQYFAASYFPLSNDKIIGLVRDVTQVTIAEQKLKESQKLLELFFSQSLTGFFFMMLDEPVEWHEGVDKEKVLDYVFAHHRITKINQAMLDQYGAKSVDEFVGLTPNDLFAHDLQHGREVWRKFFDEGKLHIDTNEERFDGSPLFVEGDYCCLYDEQGRITGHFGIQQDITDKKVAQQNLQRSRDSYQSLINNIPGVAYRSKLDRDRTPIFISEFIEKMSGYASGEFFDGSVSFGLLIVPEDRERVYREVVAAVQERRNWEIEYRIMHRNGTIRWAYEKGNPVFDEKGEVEYVEGFILDNTERKIAEQELDTERKLFAAGPVLYVIWDPDTLEITYISENVKDVLGYDREEFAHNPFMDREIVHPDDLSAIEEATLYHLQAKSNSYEISYRLKVKDGGYKWYYDFTNIVYGSNGKVESIRGYLFDQSHIKEVEATLQQERRRLADIIRGTNVGTWEWNVQTGETIFNERWAEIVGYTLDELQPTTIETWASFAHPGDLEKSNSILERHFAGELDYYECEARMKHRDGHWVWVLDRGSIASTTADGKPLLVSGTHQDISDRKKIEEALAAGSQMLRNLAEQVPGVVYQYQLYPDGRQRFPFASDSVKDIYEVNPEEIANDAQKVLERLHPDDYEATLTSITESAERLTVWELDYRVILPLKGLRWLRGIARPTLLEDGSTMWHGYIADITERKKADLELQLVKEQFSLAVEGSNDGIWDWDVANDRVYFSPRWKEMIGYQDHELVNEFATFERLFHPDDRERIMTAIQNYFEGLADTYQVEFRFRHKKGHYVWILARGKAFRDAQGRPYRMAGSHTDISRQKEYERLLQESAEEAKQASKAKSEFLANMSHEIRTPLNSVIGFSHLLAQTDLDSTQMQYAENVNISGKALLSIINDILDFSKIEAGKLEMERVPTNLHAIAKEAISTIQLQATQKGLELLLNVPLDVPQTVMADPTRLRQVVTNLLSNAVKFTEKGEVELKISMKPVPESETVDCTIEVRDTGIGISQAEQKKLFKVFSQADSSTTRKYGGTGLGLAISGMLVEKMGGKIGIRSIVGSGSSFFFTLRLEATPIDKADDATAVPIRHVLIIDDNEHNRQILQTTIQAIGAKTTAVPDGLKALHELEQNADIDLIVCDYNMPYINGLQTVRLIRGMKKANTGSLKVVLLHSSQEETIIREESEALGVKMRLLKPVLPSDLVGYLLHSGTKKSVTISETEAGGTKNSTKPLTILIAEDVVMNMVLAKIVIRKIIADAEIIEAKNGKIAIEMAIKHKPDIIFMDVQMPEKSGIEATKEILALPEMKLSPPVIIALTAGALVEEKERCLEAGMNDFLSKPIDQKELEIVLGKFIA